MGNAIGNNNGDDASDALCVYLNMTKSGNSGQALAKLDALYANVSLLERLLTVPIVRQWQYAKCGQQYYMDTLADKLMTSSKLLPGTILPFIPQIIVPGILALVSVCFNASIIMVTFRHIKVRSTTNWLLAFDALCQLCATSLFVANTVAAIFWVPVLNFRICMATSFATTVAFFASYMTVYLISLERLLITMAPVRIEMQKSAVGERNLSLLAVFVAIAFGVGMNNYMLMQQDISTISTGLSLYNLGEGNSRLYCNPLMHMAKLNSWITFGVLLLALLDYGLIFARILWRHLRGSSAAVDPFTRQMLRTLFILSLALVLGQLLPTTNNIYTLFYQALVRLFNFGDTPQQQRDSVLLGNITVFAGSIKSIWLPLLASASGVPILFFSSTVYRNAYKCLLKRAIRIAQSNGGTGHGGRLFNERNVPAHVETTGITTKALTSSSGNAA